MESTGDRNASMRKSLKASFVTVDMLLFMFLFGLDLLAGCGWGGLGNGTGTHCWGVLRGG